MHSMSSVKVATLRDGVTYNLPRSYYRMSIGEGATNTLKIEVVQDIQPDSISFSLDISRNPLVDRKQNYGVNPKGLLTTAKSEDTGKLPEILEATAKSIVAIGNAGIGADGIPKASFTQSMTRQNNQLSAAEYAAFIAELTKLNYKYVCKAGDSARGKSIPTEGGNFRLNFQAPAFFGNRANEADIRDSLRQAGRRAGAIYKNVDDDILAAGVLARPLTSGMMSYTILVKKDAVNRLRDGETGNNEKVAESKVKAKRAEINKATEQANKWPDEQKRLKAETTELETKKVAALADGKAMEELLAAILRAPESARAKLEEFNKRQLAFNKSDGYWANYGDALDASPAEGEAATDKKIISSKAITLNTEVQKMVNAATKAIADQIVVNKSALGSLEVSDRDWPDQMRTSQDELDVLRRTHERASNASAHATVDIPIVIATDRMPVIDEAHAQLIPLRRSMVGKVTNEVTLVDGVVSAHAIDEPSEVLGTVKIPLTVVEAILGTVSSMWTKKKEAQTSQTEYLTAETKLIEARAALEAARVKESTNP